MTVAAYNDRHHPAFSTGSMQLRGWSPFFFTAAVALHWLAAGNLATLVGVLLALGLAAIPCALFAYVLLTGSSKSALRFFWLFISVYFLMAGFARAAATYFNETNEVYQNASDAWTIYVLSADRFGLDSDSLSRITDTGGAITIFSFFYRVVDFLALPLSPGIGVAVNVTLVALGATIGVVGAMKAFPQEPAIWRVVTILFASSGMAFLFASHHLRDSFVFALSSVFFYLLISIDLSKIFSSTIVGILIAIILSYIMSYFRGESIFILIGFLATLSVDYAFRKERIIRYIIFAAMGILGIYLLLNFQENYSEQIEATRITYDEAVGQSGGLAADYIFNQPPYIRIFVGSVYLLLLNIPFFVGFVEKESFYWFISIQATQSLFVFPAVIFTISRFFVNTESESIFILRRLAIFYAMMLGVISLTTLGYRHIGQFSACLYLLSAYGYCHSSRAYKIAGLLVIAIGLPAAWLIMRG